jgi:hypothetical protein
LNAQYRELFFLWDEAWKDSVIDDAVIYNDKFIPVEV